MCPPAHATPQQDGIFLIAIGEAGIGYESSSVAILAAHEVCDALDAGRSFSWVIKRLTATTGLSQSAAARFATAAIHVYCGQRGSTIRPVGPDQQVRL
ncbi:DUF732 domain-containing protein [Mycobacterium sp. CSUR Q5927]|nr:DUF732 domain-containing protein [Mycobacterium sp. CSUR Q5927]